MYRGLELWRCAAGVRTCRYLSQEIWSSGGLARAWGRGGVCFKSSGDVLQACRCRGICLKSSGALEARCRRRDVEVWRYGAGGHAAGVGTLPQKRSGSALQACRCGSKERYEDLELGRHAVGLRTSKCRGLEVCAAVVQMWRCLPQEIWISGSMPRAWGRVGVCLKSSRGSLQV